MPNDPICGMEVGELTEYQTAEDGITVYFYSDHCLGTFLKGDTQDAPAADAGMLHTRPMHSEVRQDHPSDYSKGGITVVISIFVVPVSNSMTKKREIKNKERRYAKETSRIG